MNTNYLKSGWGIRCSKMPAMTIAHLLKISFQ